MNQPQPKFKFGDKCQHTDNDPPFIVKNIAFAAVNSDGTGEYRYNGKFWESETELYQEPQKKKLYAFKCRNTQWFGFTDKPLSVEDGDFDRVPEYDIEYGDDK